jgi:hypothetical protein
VGAAVVQAPRLRSRIAHPPNAWALLERRSKRRFNRPTTSTLPTQQARELAVHEAHEILLKTCQQMSVISGAPGAGAFPARLERFDNTRPDRFILQIGPDSGVSLSPSIHPNYEILRNNAGKLALLRTEPCVTLSGRKFGHCRETRDARGLHRGAFCREWMCNGRTVDQYVNQSQPTSALKESIRSGAICGQESRTGGLR